MMLWISVVIELSLARCQSGARALSRGLSRWPRLAHERRRLAGRRRDRVRLEVAEVVTHAVFDLDDAERPVERDVTLRRVRRGPGRRRLVDPGVEYRLQRVTVGRASGLLDRRLQDVHRAVVVE